MRLRLACLLALGCSGTISGTPGGDPDAALPPPPAADGAPVITPDGAPVTTPDAGAPPTMGHPFGTHGGYHTDGVLFPTHRTQAELDAATAAFYDDWKSRYVMPGCAAGHYRIKTSPATAAYTVSEGHGYGMLAAAIMHGHDPEARTIFDGLYAYYEAHPSSINPALMAWAQDDSCQNVMGDASATDGDLDIAYALLLAHAQWGSDGAVDYLQAAERIIGAILESEVHPANSVLLGDWASDPSSSHYTGTRTSDLMISQLRAFGAATGVARWNDVVDRSYAVIDSLQDSYAGATGLLPDFATGAAGGTPQPAPVGWLEGDNDGRYGWNACRTPWRIATDYLMSGDPRARAAVQPLNAWIRAATGDDPGAIAAGYELDGQSTAGYQSLAFTAPFAVSAMIEPPTGTNEPWLNALWDEVIARGSESYYEDSIKLFVMIVVSGNWWTP